MGVGNVLVGLEKTGERLIMARRIPFCVQKASSDRAWFEALTESALYKASTRRIVRLQPNVGPASFNPGTNKKKNSQVTRRKIVKSSLTN
jgi:hypothetical protein